MISTKVLIVDDSPEDVEYLTSLLQAQDNGYQVSDAHNSLQGLEELQNWQPDCVLLDFRLGHEDGIEVLQAFLSHQHAKPVIMLTGQGSEVVAAAAIKAGASDYLVKLDINAVALHKAISKSVESAQMRALLKLQEDALKRQSRLQALGHLSAGIAHDFNNMLATIQHAVESARRSTDLQKIGSRLDTIQTVVTMATDRVDNLLAFTKSQSGRKSERMNSQVMKELEEMTHGPISKSCDIQFDHGVTESTLYCDQNQLLSALLNLIVNAHDAILASNQRNGLIQVSSTRLPDNSQVEFCVADNGGGIPEEIIDKVTDPYFTTKLHTGGTGLGLSMVYGFAQQCGGTFSIEADQHIGTTSVRFRVPASKDDEKTSKHPAQNYSIASRTKKRTILLIDDNTILLTLMKEELALEGFTVLAANNCESALAQVSNLDETDAVITDMSLGESESGLDLATKIRALLPNIQIIGITGFRELNTAEYKKTLNTLLKKPCYIHELVFVLNSFNPQLET
jgi:signal transduction histidine kinase